MDKIRCLIADMPQLILADIISDIAVDQRDIDVVDRVETIDDVPAVLGKRDIDVLIIGMSSDLSFNYCKDIVKRFPRTLVIGLPDDGRSAIVCKGDVGREEIIKLIHALAVP